MAEYTVELRTIIENGINIFDFPYDFHNEELKPKFEQDFIRHFYFREIGCQTINRFKWYLEDKMKTVFPYYNELFKSASIQYDVLDNYKLTETYTRKVDSENKQSGISSTVGQAFGNQETETNQNRTVNTVGTFDGTENGTETETGKTTTEATGKTTTEKSGNSTTVTSGNSTTETSGTSNTTSTETTEGSNSKTTNSSGSTEQDTVEKFLDTPQGLTDLTNSKYLTTLKQTTTDGSQTSESSESGSDSRTTNGSNNTTTTESSETDTTENSETNTTDNSETNTTDNSETNTQATKTKSNTIENDTTGKETTADNVTGTLHNEEKTTSDNNTRMYSNGEQNETYTLTRRGNIGVDTDSDAIEKHNRLQKTLRRIELMFFDECEDLFMMVY